MAKAVFTTKAGSGYDDDLDVQYHFPSGGRFAHYLWAAMAAEGDWILYQEPRRNGGRMAYVAVARVVRVQVDPRNPGHHYAYVSDALPFDQPVPLEGPYGIDLSSGCARWTAGGSAPGSRAIRSARCRVRTSRRSSWPDWLKRAIPGTPSGFKWTRGGGP